VTTCHPPSAFPSKGKICLAPSMLKFPKAVTPATSAILLLRSRDTNAKTLRLTGSPFSKTGRGCGRPVASARNWWMQRSGQLLPNVLLNNSSNATPCPATKSLCFGGSSSKSLNYLWSTGSNRPNQERGMGQPKRLTEDQQAVARKPTASPRQKWRDLFAGIIL
jgi:hypothetical protein